MAKKPLEEMAQEVPASSTKSLRDIFSERQASDFQGAVADAKRSGDDVLSTWMQDYTTAISNQGKWIVEYGLKAGMFKSSIKDLGKKGLLRYFVEAFPNSDWLVKVYNKSKAGDINQLPGQVDDVEQILIALYRSVEETEKLLQDIQVESNELTGFYNNLLDDLSKQKREVLESRKTLEGKIQGTTSELEEKKRICEEMGVPFNEDGYVLKSALSNVGTSIDELTQEQNRSDAIRAYESVYFTLTNQKGEYTVLERQTADLQIRIKRATEEDNVNTKALKGTISNLLAHQQLLKSEYTAAIESSIPISKIASQVAVAEALNVRAEKALEEFHANLGELINLTVNGGEKIMRRLRELVESNNYSDAQLERYVQVVSETDREIDALYKKLAHDVDQARTQKIAVPDLPTSYNPGR